MRGVMELDELVVPDAYGRPFIRARVPRITRRFSSPLHTTANVTARLGGWRSELSHFLDGRVPVARLTEDSVEPDAAADLRRSVIDALELGFLGGVTSDVAGGLTARLALPDAIAETMDLAALRHDWLWWLNAAGILDDRVRVAVAHAVDELEGRAFGSYLWSLPPMTTADVGQALRHGALIGDEPAMTCAAVLRSLTGESRYWQECM
jgi:hypothetical protein